MQVVVLRSVYNAPQWSPWCRD